MITLLGPLLFKTLKIVKMTTLLLGITLQVATYPFVKRW